MKKSYIFSLFLVAKLLLSNHLYAQFSWRSDTPAYPDADIDGHNYTNVGGTPSRDVSISPFSVGSAVGWQSMNPRVSTSSSSRLLLGVNLTTDSQTNASVSFTMTFSSPVCGLTFPIYEIDRGNFNMTEEGYDYMDEVVISATTEGGGAVPTPTIIPSASASVSGNVITGNATDNSASPGAATTVSYPANHCVKTLTITYRTGADARSNPNQQLISIGDMNWNNSLPVNLLAFQSEPQQTGVELSWQTSEEINNSHFEVERSSDALSFETIGRVMGRGNTTENVTYTYIDASARVGLNYYRLKQVDFDGKFEYSRIIAARFDGDGSFRVYPNPATDRISIQLPQDEEIKSIQLVDMIGKTIKYSENHTELRIKDITNGTYILKVKTLTGRIFSQKIAKYD